MPSAGTISRLLGHCGTGESASVATSSGGAGGASWSYGSANRDSAGGSIEKCPAATAGRGSSRRPLPRRPGWPTPGRTRACSRPATPRPGRRGPPACPAGARRCRISDSSVFSWISPRHLVYGPAGRVARRCLVGFTVAARNRHGPRSFPAAAAGETAAGPVRPAADGHSSRPPSWAPLGRYAEGPAVVRGSVSASYIGLAGWIS